MEVTFEVTQRDFRDAFIAHRNRLAIVKWALRLMVSFLLLLAGVGLILLALQPDFETFGRLGPLLALAVVWAVYIWGVPRWMARSQYLKQPSAHGPITVVFDAEGGHWRWDGGSSEVQWKNFIRWVEAKEQILLYPSPAYFNIVPKRAFTAEQMTEFRALIGQNIPPGR